ncbi:hypothetical protein BTHERMOSOX_1383 [Bathymodiolus thermophilus thioautotrophic gill symbiont]|uniref:hypothetical protein n=1 Tax=Bathymodiolus thermophilus thioautotrophic gill symbiont TaxID=2360 RepID=UPI0010B3E7D0|nr:hypothetical protein [Bathymodiolus thermophilus thioautotrophic gill symbiont]SGZ65502.1 hypothetical protein BTHERMOSOX_1383 [Bathymodiolus thermophilus thioautotrophic gill symbiont]
MKIVDWIEWLDVIVQVNGREFLNYTGKISRKIALEKYQFKEKRITENISFNQLEKDIKTFEKI